MGDSLRFGMQRTFYIPITPRKTLVGVVMDKDSNTLRCIKRFKSFVVNIPSARLRSLVLEAGAVSGSNTNKMATLTSMCGSPLCAVPTTELPSNQPVVLSCSVLDVTNNDKPTEAFLGHISCTLDTEWEVPHSDGSILVVGHITGAKADSTLFLHGFWNFTNESNDLRVTLCHAGADKFFSHKS